MEGINKVILLGHLGKDPLVRYLTQDRMRASFTLATDEAYSNKQGERVIMTTWHNVVLWSPLAKVTEKGLKKGQRIYLEGRITSRTYVDKEGQRQRITEIVGQQIVLLGNNHQGS